MRIDVDLDRCQGHALCVAHASDLFDLDEETSRAVVLVSDVVAQQAELARDAADGCPEQAIMVSA